MNSTPPWPAAISLPILGLIGLVLLGKSLAPGNGHVEPIARAILALLGVAVLILFVRFIVMAAGIRHRENLRSPKRKRR